MIIIRHADPHITFYASNYEKQGVLFFDAADDSFKVQLSGRTYRVNLTQI